MERESLLQGDAIPQITKEGDNLIQDINDSVVNLDSGDDQSYNVQPSTDIHSDQSVFRDSSDSVLDEGECVATIKSGSDGADVSSIPIDQYSGDLEPRHISIASEIDDPVELSDKYNFNRDQELQIELHDVKLAVDESRDLQTLDDPISQIKEHDLPLMENLNSNSSDCTSALDSLATSNSEEINIGADFLISKYRGKRTLNEDIDVVSCESTRLQSNCKSMKQLEDFPTSMCLNRHRNENSGLRNREEEKNKSFDEKPYDIVNPPIESSEKSDGVIRDFDASQNDGKESKLSRFNTNSTQPKFPSEFPQNSRALVQGLSGNLPNDVKSRFSFNYPSKMRLSGLPNVPVKPPTNFIEVLWTLQILLSYKSELNFTTLPSIYLQFFGYPLNIGLLGIEDDLHNFFRRFSYIYSLRDDLFVNTKLLPGTTYELFNAIVDQQLRLLYPFNQRLNNVSSFNLYTQKFRPNVLQFPQPRLSKTVDTPKNMCPITALSNSVPQSHCKLPNTLMNYDLDKTVTDNFNNTITPASFGSTVSELGKGDESQNIFSSPNNALPKDLSSELGNVRESDSMKNVASTFINYGYRGRYLGKKVCNSNNTFEGKCVGSENHQFMTIKNSDSLFRGNFGRSHAPSVDLNFACEDENKIIPQSTDLSVIKDVTSNRNFTTAYNTILEGDFNLNNCTDEEIIPYSVIVLLQAIHRMLVKLKKPIDVQTIPQEFEKLYEVQFPWGIIGGISPLYFVGKFPQIVRISRHVLPMSMNEKLNSLRTPVDLNDGSLYMVYPMYKPNFKEFVAMVKNNQSSQKGSIIDQLNSDSPKKGEIK